MIPLPTNLASRLAWSLKRADLRQPSADELRLLTEAGHAGSVFTLPNWEEYFSGESTRFPTQFEGCYAYASDVMDPAAMALVDAARARRDAFLARVRPGGDLYATVSAVSAALVAMAVAA